MHTQACQTLCMGIYMYIYIYMCVCVRVCYAHIIYIIYQICACNLLTSKHSWNMIPRSHASRKSPCRSTGCKRLQSRNGCLSSPLKSWLPCSARHCALQNHSCCRGKLLSIDMIITYNYIVNKQQELSLFHSLFPLLALWSLSFSLVLLCSKVTTTCDTF